MGAVAVVYVAVVAFIVFWPAGEMPTSAVAHLYEWLQSLGAPVEVTQERIEFVCNVLLFVPMSMLGSLLKPQWTWSAWVVVGYCATFTIELVQAFLLPGRSATMQDVVANTGGALIGALAALVIRHRTVSLGSGMLRRRP